MRKNELLQKLNLPNAFEHFDADKNSVLWGWNGDVPAFEGLIQELLPTLIIEVGSWLGQSTSTMAQALKRHGLENSSILAIDTWLGSQEHWSNPEHREHLGLEFGYPTLYRRFLSNMKNATSEDKIVPLPLPSLIAARYLSSKGVVAELIYIDGSHDEKDVYDDLSAYWELLARGGIIFGDDWSIFDSVNRAVTRFAQEKSLQVEINGFHWRMRKR